MSSKACDECSHPNHDDECEACDEEAQVGCYAPCTRVCSCGHVGTIEVHGNGEREQSITVCANCGSDE